MKLNTIQSIAVAGVISSAASQLGLYLLDKQVDNFIYVYPIWVAIFLLGTAIRIYRGGVVEHHHHDHDH
jgi:hypothetical protein